MLCIFSENLEVTKIYKKNIVRDAALKKVYIIIGNCIKENPK